MWFALLGVPGALQVVDDNVDTLLTRCTETRLARLDTNVASRAPASTALSNAEWTNTRAALLDNLDAPISSAGSSISFQSFTASGTFNPPKPGWYLVSGVAGGGGGGVGSGGDGGGGGGAGESAFWWPVFLFDTTAISVTIGGGGNGGSSSSDAGDDGTLTSFGSYLSLAPGKGGHSTTASGNTNGGNGSNDTYAGGTGSSTATGTAGASATNSTTFTAALVDVTELFRQFGLGTLAGRKHDGGAGGGGSNSALNGGDGGSRTYAHWDEVNELINLLGSAGSGESNAGGDSTSGWEGGGGGASCFGLGGQRQGSAGTTNVVVPGYGAGGAGGSDGILTGQGGGGGYLEIWWL